MDNDQTEQIEDMDIEVVPSMWPEDIDSEKPYNVEKPRGDQDMLEEVTIVEEPSIVDFHRLIELTNYTDRGSSQLAYLVKHWEYQQINAVRLLKEELDILSQQRQEVELKKLEILEDFRFEEEGYGSDKRPISILDEVIDLYQVLPIRKKDVTVQNKRVVVDAEYDTVAYWKQRTMDLEKLLEASIQREQVLIEKLQESIKDLERQSSPVEELSQILKRADNFLHFILQNAPVVMGHQDKELRYRFIYNHFPRLGEEDILGKTDMEIFSGAGVKESQDFKREVLEKGLPAKREITFETELFGSKTFLIYVEPVFSKSGVTIGINYMGMDVTDQVRKREKMAKLREEIAVQKAKETELNKTIHITEETMRAKQMLATMSHEIRSPLSGVVSMAEILSTTNLDREQRQLLNVMISSGDLVLQLINDILDLSKVESGVMKLEATKFRPREVVKHVLQTAAASLKKFLILEGCVADDVPIEVIGDVLRIRQILTNLISNAIKFTHEGKVGINLYVVADPCFGKADGNHQKSSAKEEAQSQETLVWLRCDVYDTGIGIPENALPTLFKKYMQVSADHARKYGGTGLGLAICKQLVELMGGRLTVSSRVNCGSTFTFILPYKVSSMCDSSDDAEELSEMADHDAGTEDETAGFFSFQPLTLGSPFSSNGSTRTQKIFPHNSHKLNGLSDNLYSFPSSNVRLKETASVEDACSTVEVADTLSEPESSYSHSPEPDNENVACRSKQFQDDSSQLHNCTMVSTCHVEPCREVDAQAIEREPQGSCFAQEKSDISSQPTCGRSPQVPMSKLQPKILLVEDNNVNVMVTRSMMKQLGHTIDVVNNGIEAVRAVQGNCYDLVLMDVCMPVMDGLQATRLIRSFEETGSWDAATKAGIELSAPFSSSLPDSPGCMPSTRRTPIIAAVNADDRKCIVRKRRGMLC
ncbi:sensor histidine kinase, putative [Ricinus communis]|uniref:histidine kinase n=1 Tax=Ricinus communis TaxID=3988 RepID=B9RNQ2_RICCO|nr:sensor histidine kinase, putative [Ricinus communis]